MWRTVIILGLVVIGAPISRSQEDSPVRMAETTPAVVPVPASRGALPDAPKAKIEPGQSDENSPCPAGNGKPCAFLGGMRYYRDLGHMTEHDRTWSEAMKHPMMWSVAAFLIGTTALDIEGTDHCLKLHSCREINPIMPKTANRAWQYGAAMSIDTLGIYGLGRIKKIGKGNRGFFILATASLLHLYEGTTGFANGPVSATALGQTKSVRK